MTETLFSLGETLVNTLKTAGQTVATAESCTGGWIAKVLTDIAGSSSVFGYGVVSYSNGAKASMLDVSEATLDEHGAVSEAVVIEMAEGVRQLAGSDIGVAVSGIAGPDGGSDDKPVGTVWFAWSTAGAVETDRQVFPGGRDEVRSMTVAHAIRGVQERLAGRA
ncbi:MAG: CinA family protein [Woeseiaceae bacterium]|nr:CinA family protein [Woeseiaceae bacterium]